MLLDQKRTRRMVQVVSILTSLAFGGVILVVLGLIFFGGGGSSAEDQLKQTRDERLTAVKADPRNADAWEDLAFAYLGTKEFDRAVSAQRRAIALEPNDFDRVTALVGIQQQAGDNDGAIASVQTYTARHPANAEALQTLGTLAERANRTDLARLSYQAFLRLAPDDPNAAAIKARIKDLQ